MRNDDPDCLERPRRSSLRLIAAIITLLSFGTACTTVHRVSTSELAKLDGFEREEKSVLKTLNSLTKTPRYQLADERRKLHTFNSGTLLILETQPDGKPVEIESRYRRISVSDAVFRGLERDSDHEVAVPLADVKHAGVREFSVGKTVGLVALVAGTLLVGLTVLAVTLDDGDDHSHHDWDWD